MVCEAFGGGVFEYVLQLCNDICEDYKVCLFYSMRPDTPLDYKDSFHRDILLIEGKNFGKKTNSISNHINAMKELRRIEQEIKPDIIHLHSSIAGVYGRIAYARNSQAIVYTPHGYAHILMGYNWKTKIYEIVEKLLGKISNTITLTCCESEEDVAKTLTQKTAFIETGIHLKELEIISLKSVLDKRENFTVFTSGRMRLQKQPKLFNEIASMVPDADFIWIGDGEGKEELTSPNIQITGWKTRKEALAIAKSSDVFILCSLGEAIAMTLIENMYLGKLCLVSNVVGNKSVIRNGHNGYVCESAEEYAKCIKDAMVRFPDYLVKQACEDILNVYNTEVMKKKYLEFYGRC